MVFWMAQTCEMFSDTTYQQREGKTTMMRLKTNKKTNHKQRNKELIFYFPFQKGQVLK